MAFRTPEYSCLEELQMESTGVGPARGRFPSLSDCSFWLITCYFNKELFSSATLQGSPYLAAGNADLFHVGSGSRAKTNGEAGQGIEREPCGRNQGFQGVEAPW